MIKTLDEWEETVRQRLAKTAYSESTKEELLIPIMGQFAFDITSATRAEIAAELTAIRNCILDGNEGHPTLGEYIEQLAGGAK